MNSFLQTKNLRLKKFRLKIFKQKKKRGKKSQIHPQPTGEMLWSILLIYSDKKKRRKKGATKKSVSQPAEKQILSLLPLSFL